MITERDKQAYECLGMLEVFEVMLEEDGRGATQDQRIVNRIVQKLADFKARNANPSLGPMSDVVTKVSPDPGQVTTPSPAPECSTCGSPEKAERWCGVERDRDFDPHSVRHGHEPPFRHIDAAGVRSSLCLPCTDLWHEEVGR